MTRAALAKEAVAICDAGWYSAPSGMHVSLEPALREAAEGTRLHSLEGEPEPAAAAKPSATFIEVTAETTIAALERLHAEEGGHLACLNFASAKNPGGGFLGGAEAQEESLARSSGLYPCLLKAPEYYARNRACRSLLYLDLAIWSPLVPFFRNDRGTLLEEPVLASVITCPAPNAGAIASNDPERRGEVEPVLRRRAAFVLALAKRYGVRRLVLGAWGCGVFRNDPRMVATAFSDLLHEGGPFARVFDQVVFAVFDRSAKQTVLRAFQTTFK